MSFVGFVEPLTHGTDIPRDRAIISQIEWMASQMTWRNTAGREGSSDVTTES